MQIKKNQNPILIDFLTAVSFLTIIPIAVAVSDRKNALPSAMIFFPVVGFGIAVACLGLVQVLEPVFGERFANLLLVLFPIVLSGGLHTDGLADFFDGFFQGKNREEILRVMRDPHIGVWGALGIVFFVLVKWELLMILPHKEKIFLVAMTLSRWSHVFLSYLQPYARPEGGLGELVARKVGRPQLTGASIFAFGAALLLAGKGLGVFGVGLFFVWLMGQFYQKKIGGITGDLLGATGEMTEIASYVLFLSFIKIGPFV